MFSVRQCGKTLVSRTQGAGPRSKKKGKGDIDPQMKDRLEQTILC